MRKIAVFVIVSAFAIAPVAQAKPNNPRAASTARTRHWFTDPKWWAGEIVIGLATAADGATTAHGLTVGLAESNPLLGAHPSAGAIAGADLGYFAFATGAHIAGWKLMDKDPNPIWRNSRYFVLPGITAGILGAHAIHNAELFPKR